jgi:hypothetical protein
MNLEQEPQVLGTLVQKTPEQKKKYLYRDLLIAKITGNNIAEAEKCIKNNYPKRAENIIRQAENHAKEHQKREAV